jgi:hypothetical protein
VGAGNHNILILESINIIRCIYDNDEKNKNINARELADGIACGQCKKKIEPHPHKVFIKIQ